jgi:uncharacterized protein YndB with AHSA1/START domain
MRRPALPPRDTSDATLSRESGRSRDEWFALIDGSGATGRAAVGKALQAERLDPWWVTTLVVEHEARAGVVEKDGRPKGHSICSTKTVSATPERAYGAFTTAADLDAWFGAATRVEARDGGTLENADGDRATFTKLRPGKALVLAWQTPDFAPGSVVEVLFQPKGDRTGLVINHTRIAARHDADTLRAMWEGALTALKSHLER